MCGQVSSSHSLHKLPPFSELSYVTAPAALYQNKDKNSGEQKVTATSLIYLISSGEQPPTFVSNVLIYLNVRRLNWLWFIPFKLGEKRMTDNETKIDKDRVVPRSSIKRRSLRIIDRASKTNTTKQSFENECFQERRKGVGTNRAIERKWRCSVDKKKKEDKIKRMLELGTERSKRKVINFFVEVKDPWK